MAVGVYPFRCLDCGWRFWVSVWLFSSLGVAKCPKCLRTDLLVWQDKYIRFNPWRRLLSTFGSHPYRCATCRYNFLSFRPLKGPAHESLNDRIDSENPGSQDSASVANTQKDAEAGTSVF